MSVLTTGVATEAARQLKAEGAAVTPSAILKRAQELMDLDREKYHGRDARLLCTGCWWCAT
jgi:hypothetical protein